MFVCNFTPVPRHGYRVGVPMAGRYRKIMDTDSTAYWGSGCFTETEYQSDDQPWQGKPASINLNLPPLATILLVPER